MVTLMEERELCELGLEDLPGRLRSLGITWHLVPLPEHGVPDPDFDSRWAAVSPELAMVLKQKGRVLIHCKDGLRRTGFVAARLLVELGCRPEDAINRVRAARPGAIDRIEQERYVLAARRSAEAAPSRAVPQRIQQPGRKRTRAEQIIGRPAALSLLAQRAAPTPQPFLTVVARHDEQDANLNPSSPLA
jgi:hypothetical protein